VTGCTNRSPTAADAIEDEVQEALAICGGDAIAALRIRLIANAFLEAEIDRLSAAVSSGFARGEVRKPARPNEAKEKIQPYASAETASITATSTANLPIVSPGKEQPIKASAPVVHSFSGSCDPVTTTTGFAPMPSILRSQVPYPWFPRFSSVSPVR
jgi:hypothetical protein